MSGCAGAGASTTDGAIDPPATVPPEPAQTPDAPEAVLRKPRTYASISRRCEGVSDPRIARRSPAVAACNCCTMGTSDGSNAVMEPPVATLAPPHEGGITSADALDDALLTGGRNGAVAGLGSLATSTPLALHTATAPTALNALNARVLRVTARRSE